MLQCCVSSGRPAPHPELWGFHPLGLGFLLYNEESYHVGTQDLPGPQKGQKARVWDEIACLFFLMAATNAHFLKIREKNSRDHINPSCDSSVNWGVQLWSVWQSETPGSWGDQAFREDFWS